MTRAVSVQRMPTAARWGMYVAIAIAFAVACAFLAQWQFDRNEARSGQLDLIAANYDQDAVPISELIPGGGAMESSDEWRPVALRGEYLADQTQLVRNRPHGGTAAYEVLVPLRLDDGRIIVVNRGWIYPGDSGAVASEVPVPPAGEVSVTARLRPGEPLPRSGRDAPDGQVPTINLPTIADLVGGDVILDAYALMSSETPPGEQANAISPPSEDPGPHLSYAIQWILFAIMGFGFIGYVIRSEIRHRREDAEDTAEAAAAAASGGSAPLPRRDRERRRDRDAADEDALLDAGSR